GSGPAGGAGMKPIEQGLRRAGGRLLASPGAVFVAVLTVGLAIGSLGHHTGLYRANAASGWRSNVVLACPRSGAPTHSTAAEATSSASTSWQDRSASASNSSADSPAGDATNPDGSPEKQPAQFRQVPEWQQFLYAAARLQRAGIEPVHFTAVKDRQTAGPGCSPRRATCVEVHPAGAENGRPYVASSR